ncbi:hypothetical protein [Burkholderia lata]|nr:hypothetical protein [Burkholderia lata]
MSLIARIQYVNFLTYSNPDSRDRKPAMRVVEFSPLKYSTAINIPNGHGKTNMISALLYLLSRDTKLKGIALPLFTPRRCGAPSHIRVQLWDLQDDLSQTDLNLDEGLLDPKDLPNKNDHHVFGLCAYQGDEPRFYYYRGVLEDCPVFDRTEGGYLYHHEAEVQQVVKLVGGTWNISSVHEWRSLITSHIPSRVLAQQVKFHLAGGGDKSAQLHQVEVDGDESFDQAFFRTVIAQELLISTSEPESDPDDPRENFEDLLYAHFSKMASATIKAEQEQQVIREQEGIVHDLAGLVIAGEKANEGHGEYQRLIANIARDGALVWHFVRNDPLPGLLDVRRQPSGRVGEIVPYIVIDKIYGAMILDAGLEKLTNVEASALNQVSGRQRLLKQEVDQTQVIDFACNLDLKTSPKGGGYARKGYTLDTALELVPLLREVGTARLAGATDTLKQAFAWVENTADTNSYRTIARRLATEIKQHQEEIRCRASEIVEWEIEVRELSDRITKYDQAKGAYEDLATSGHFTSDELNAPELLTDQVKKELRAAEGALSDHDKRVGSLESIFDSHRAFCQKNAGIPARTRLEELSARATSTRDDRTHAEQRLERSKAELAQLNVSKVEQEGQYKQNQQQLDVLLELQSHQPAYTKWFGDTLPHDIDIRGNIKEITDDEKALAQRREERERFLHTISVLSLTVPRYRELFGDADAESIDISGALQNISTQEKALGARRGAADALHTRIQSLKSFVEIFHRIFGNTDPTMLDPGQERADLQKDIALTEAVVESLGSQVSRLNLFRDEHPGWTAAAWLADMESQRATRLRQIAQYNQQILTAERQLAELMSDPVARPEDVACAHALLDEAVPFVPLHIFVESHCPPTVKQQWLTHFSALLFAPVVESIEEAAEAARILHDGQFMMPVLIASRLRDVMESDAPALALEGECAYTWLAGIKTRLVHCLLNPAAVEEERTLAKQRLSELRELLAREEEALGHLSETSPSVLLARDAARAETSNAETELTASSERFKELRKQLPDVLARNSSEALDSIQNTREYQSLIRQHGENVAERIEEELHQLDEQADVLRQAREWHEARNSDTVREVIMDMRRYQALLAEHGVDALQKATQDLQKIAEEAEDLRRSREWYEARDQDDIHAAVSAMRRYRDVDGDAEVVRLENVVKVSTEKLSAIATKIVSATHNVNEDENHLSTARDTESNASAAYLENKQYLEALVSFSESKDLAFMETHEESRISLEIDKRRADARKSYQSQFPHAQRYVNATRDGQTSEQELLTRKASVEIKVTEANRQQEQDRLVVEEKIERRDTLKNYQDALHEAACQLLGEFRAVSNSLNEIRAAVTEGAPRFENTALYQHADSIRGKLERADGDPFFLDDIRTISRLAGELGLAGQSKDIAQARRLTERLTREYQDRKSSFCTEIITGTRRGLSVLNAEWLLSQDRFDAPLEMKTQIEVSLASNRALLQQATTSLEFARDKTTEMLTILAKDAERALSILDEAMTTTPTSRFYVNANVITEDKIGDLLDHLYSNIEAEMRRKADSSSLVAEKRHRKRALDELRTEVYRSLFSDVSVEFRHPSIWEGGQHPLTSKGLSEGMRTAISLMWIAKLAEFRLRQAIDQAGGMRRQNRAALRKERYFVILDGLFSNLSHDDMIDSAMESLRLSAGHFQLIGMIHHPRYINNPKIFPAYFVGRPYRANGGKHSWLTVDPHKAPPGSLGVFGSQFSS